MPGVKFDELSQSYDQEQSARIVKYAQRIAARDNAISAGRVVPEDGDLPIGTGRRLSAAVLFLDISRFSSIPSESTNEQDRLLRVLTFFFSEMIRIVEDYGGSVEKNTGDGLMAYFEPQPSLGVAEHQRALSAAITMFHAADHYLNPIIVAGLFARINFRVCIDHGEITVASVGAARRFGQLVAIGTTANIASKMLAFAEPNTILLGEQMLAGLPLNWRAKFVTLKSSDTGWMYRVGGKPYAFYQYSGRWIKPT